MSEVEYTFTLTDVIAKYGEPQYWICHFTGVPIQADKPSTYSFDHPIPVMRGGLSCLDNFAICSKRANEAKSDLNIAEFLALSKRVLEHNGFSVSGGEHHTLPDVIPERAVVGKRTNRKSTKVHSGNPYFPPEFDDLEPDDGMPDIMWLSN